MGSRASVVVHMYDVFSISRGLSERETSVLYDGGLAEQVQVLNRFRREGRGHVSVGLACRGFAILHRAMEAAHIVRLRSSGRLGAFCSGFG
jgi:hypothetical protein